MNRQRDSLKPEQKKALVMLRTAFRKIAANTPNKSYWDFAYQIDDMLDEGKCTLAGSTEELIDKCVDELVKFTERAHAAIAKAKGEV